MDLDWDNLNTEELKKSHTEAVSDDEEWEYVDEIFEEDDSDNPTVNEAIKRIEQAKLYESLLRHDFFAPGSARPEIQSKVTKEIRDFILERLTVLVGIKQAMEEVSTPVAAAMPWDENQIEALTSIADRLVEKKNSSKQSVNPVVKPYAGASSSSPVVNVAGTTQQENTPKMNPPEPQVKVRKVKRRKVQQQEAPKPATPEIETKKDPVTGNPVSENGITLYKGQVANKSKPAKKMPSQREMDMLNNRQVQRQSIGSGSVGDKLLGLAITHAQNLNSNIIEED